MEPLSTYGKLQLSTYAIQNAQANVDLYAEQASSGKKAQDLQGFGQSSEQITATQAVASRISTYLSTGTVLSGQLSLQDTTLKNVASAAGSASTAVSSAVAAGDGSALMTQLQAAFSGAVTSLNTQYNGQYVYSGGNSNTAPVTATQLSDLTTPAATANIGTVFTNGSLQQVSRLDDNTQAVTGQLASTVGTPLFTALQSIEAYNQGPNGPFGTTLTAAQTTFLEGVMPSLTAAQSGVTAIASQNGAVQSQLTSVSTNLTDQQTTLTTQLSNLTDADVAQVASNLSLAQDALQASAQVFSTLKSASLLTYLGASSSSTG